MKHIIALVLIVIAAPFVLQAGYGFYHGRDVASGLITLAKGLV